MRFEKWQALGNDYLVVERDRLPFALTAGRARRLCHRHLGLGADGVLELSPPTQPGTVADLRILNPDGSEAELSGNGAREAILYLHRRGWTSARQFSITTVAGEIRPTILDERTCRVDMGRARTRSDAFPAGDDDGRGTVTSGGRDWAFQHVSVGNPQCAIRLPDAAAVDALDLPAVGPGIEHDAQFPRRTNVSFYAPLGDGRIRARIFERGVGETMSSGTGATGAAVAHVLRGGEGGAGSDEERTSVTVVLDGGELLVEVDDALHVDLTGWAVPVFTGEVDPDLLAELEALAG